MLNFEVFGLNFRRVVESVTLQEGLTGKPEKLG